MCCVQSSREIDVNNQILYIPDYNNNIQTLQPINFYNTSLTNLTLQSKPFDENSIITIPMNITGRFNFSCITIKNEELKLDRLSHRMTSIFNRDGVSFEFVDGTLMIYGALKENHAGIYFVVHSYHSFYHYHIFPIHYIKTLNVYGMVVYEMTQMKEYSRMICNSTKVDDLFLNGRSSFKCCLMKIESRMKFNGWLFPNQIINIVNNNRIMFNIMEYQWLFDLIQFNLNHLTEITNTLPLLFINQMSIYQCSIIKQSLFSYSGHYSLCNGLLKITPSRISLRFIGHLHISLRFPASFFNASFSFHDYLMAINILIRITCPSYHHCPILNNCLLKKEQCTEMENYETINKTTNSLMDFLENNYFFETNNETHKVLVNSNHFVCAFVLNLIENSSISQKYTIIQPVAYEQVDDPVSSSSSSSYLLLLLSFNKTIIEKFNHTLYILVDFYANNHWSILHDPYEYNNNNNNNNYYYYNDNDNKDDVDNYYPDEYIFNKLNSTKSSPTIIKYKSHPDKSPTSYLII